MSLLGSDFARDGWAPRLHLLDAALVEDLRIAMEARGIVGPVRNAFAETPVVRAVALSEAVLAFAAEALGAEPIPVRAAWFDKSPGANWPVAWHQDKTIGVQQRIDVVGYGPWSVKDGVPHVEPPLSVLDNMVAVRILVDDCEPDRGPLRVVPGTHGAKLSRDGIEAAVRAGPVIDIVGAAGDAIAMRPLLVHGSRRSTVPHSRRVLHLEFSAGPLPRPLRWHAAVAGVAVSPRKNGLEGPSCGRVGAAERI